MPGVGEISQTTLGLESLAPDSGHSQEVIGSGERSVLFFYQQPGDGSGVTQVDGQFQMRPAKKSMLAGEAANQARPIGVQGQVVIPKGLVAGLGDSIQTVSTAVMQGGTKG
ncbi:hypothetical protein BK662_25715 [Pseudomonas frederiksbergensis]|uniref:Uncharacterized protein n=1 Tax=Pseudomonas frederiksbergensis TaxID=104087 RepID=A0A423HGQ2_9PSED|nr:hypothetical protein BK662_25715 [Pseudomonas frederiksbergensis]